MKNPENDKWLDDVLSETIGSEKPKTDFEKWKQEHRQAVEMLTSKAGRDSSISQGPLSIRSIIMKSPVTKLAAAAMLLLGLFMLGRLLIGSETPQDPNQTRTATTTQVKEQNDTNRLQILLDSELEIAQQLFEKKDLPGLMQLLQKCQEPTKLQIAEYLGQIGDSSVLSDLQIYAEKWQGPELENPFRKAIEAIEAIQARLAESKPEPQATTSNQEPNQTQIIRPPVQTGVKGIVIDKNTAQPIQSAQVGFRPSEMVTVDTNGRFQLIYTEIPEEAYVCAAASGYASSRIMVRMKTASIQEVTIELSPGSKLAGTVTDPNAQTVEGAKVSVSGLSLPGGKVTTDEKGQFEIDGLNPAGQYYQIHVNHPAYPAVSVSINPAPAGQTLYQDIILKPGVTVFGQITNPEGLPVASVTVGNTRSGSMWNNITTETDEEGMYRLENLDIGELILWTVHEQYAPFVEYTTLDKGKSERRIDIRLKAPHTLNGRVVDSEGKPVPNAIVGVDEYNGVRNLDRNRHSCDSEGRFTIANAPQDGNLMLWVFGEGISRKEYKADLSLDECLITVERSGKIFGKVVDDDTGEPITKFLVKMTASRIGPRTYGYSSNWSEEGHTFDSAQGFFDTGRESLPINGQFQMTVSAEGYDRVTLDPVIVQPISEDPNRTEFRLRSGRVLAGRVITSDGKPIEGAAVVFFSDTNAQQRESWPRAVTDETGIFTISGLGNEPQCVFVSATGFTPRAYLMTNLLETPNNFVDIVLDHAAALFGCVSDENGNGIDGASVNAFVDTSQIRDVLTFHPSLGPRVRTDNNGNYHLPDVPVGQVQISVMSPSNYNIGHKTVDLKPGDLTELNFGDEGGYVLTGTIRAGKDVLERAYITLHSRQTESRDSYLNNRRTDINGRFKFIHVPEGQCTIFVNWKPDDARKTTEWPEDTKFEWYHSVEVRKNLNLDIDLLEGTISGIGGGSISGTVPQVFQLNDGLSLSVMQLSKSQENTTEEKWQLTIIPDIKIETDGRFTITHVPQGQCYLVMRDAEKTLALSEVLEMTEDSHINSVYFHHGNGRLLVRVVDAQTGRRIPNAIFSIVNDLQTAFMNKSYFRDKAYKVMTVDENGQCVYDGLPNGPYQVNAQGYGSFSGQSEWADVTDGRETELTVRLQPAAIVRFEFSDAIREQITTDKVFIGCIVTDTSTRAVVKKKWLHYEYDHHSVIMSLSEPADDDSSVLHLPDGTFDIEYNISTIEIVDGVQVGGGKNVAKGSTTVTCQTGQTTSIIITGQ